MQVADFGTSRLGNIVSRCGTDWEILRITDRHARRSLAQRPPPAPAPAPIAMTLNVGTPCWMAPELLDGEGDYSFSIDVYSYGEGCNLFISGSCAVV